MGSQGVYTFSLSKELKDYYRTYYGANLTTAEMAELTWIGANPITTANLKGLITTYGSLIDYPGEGANDYSLSGNFFGGRIYVLVPWKWSKLSISQEGNLPSTWTVLPPPGSTGWAPGSTGWGVDYLSYMFSNPQDFSFVPTFTVPNPPPYTSRTSPSISTWPIPFGYVETNTGSGANGDLSLINGNSLPLTITSDTTTEPTSETTGTDQKTQDTLWTNLMNAGATGQVVSPNGNNVDLTFDWLQLDPQDSLLSSKSSKYNNFKTYLQYLAGLQKPSAPLAFLYSIAEPLIAYAYFYKDGEGNPYILVDGMSDNQTGLWLLPWNKHQLSGQAQSKFLTEGNGLESPQSIYGNKTSAIYIKKRLADLTNPNSIADVVKFFNSNEPVFSDAGSKQYGGDLNIGLNYGLIGSTAILSSTGNFPTVIPSDYPLGWEPLSSTKPVGQLPSAWWYANGTKNQFNKNGYNNFIGPIANRQIGSSLWPSLAGKDPYWNTYAVAIKKDTDIVIQNSTGEMEGPYGFAMDDRLSGNLVDFNNKLKIEIGAPYTPAKQVVSIVSTTSTVNDSGAASLVFEISRTETSGPLDVYYSINTTEPSSAVFNQQYIIDGVTTPQMVKASFMSGEKAITINATPTPQTEKVSGTAFVNLKLDKDKSGNYSIDPSSASATGSITSIAPTPLSTVSVLISGPSQIPDSATQQLAYKISRSGDLSNTLSISLNLAGTAVSGVNYKDGNTLKPGINTAFFEKEQTTLTYTITPIDTNQISPLTVILSIDPASTYIVSSGHASATGTILGTTVFEQVGFQQVSDVPGRWTASVASSNKGNLGLTAFVSEAKDGTPIAGQQISLVDATGNVIAGTQFSSSERAKDSLTQAFGQKLYNAKSLAEFQSLAASSEQRSVGADNLKPIIAPASDFSIKVAGQDSIQATNANSNGVYISSFQNSTAVSFSSGIFDLFGQTSPQNVQLQATSVGKNRNTLVPYRVDSITGAILQAGSWVKPGDAAYSQAALNNSLLKGDPLNLGFGESKVASFEEGTAKSADLFALALVTNGSISDYIANNPTNQKGKGPNMFFSIGAANPDGAAHMISLDSGVVGFEDLWGGGDFDFNDVVVAFKNVPIVPIP